MLKITVWAKRFLFLCWQNTSGKTNVEKTPRKFQFGKKSAKEYHSLFSSIEQLQVALYMFLKFGLNNDKPIHTLPLRSIHSYLSISNDLIPPSRNPPSRLLRQFEFLNIKNSSAFRKYDRMTGWQEYDRTKDRQRILDEYMIDECTLSWCGCLVERA